VSRTRIKICGITCENDAQVAVRAGADALGLVFYPPSPRYVSLDQAAAIARNIPPFVTVVALFVDADVSWIESVLSNVRIDLLQFHGQETRSDCERFQRPYIKALRVTSASVLTHDMAAYPSAGGFLLDTYSQSLPGGTGQTFDWSLFPQQSEKPLILAGGLTPDNVGQAIALTHPFAVDVSGGVELTKGIKSHQLIEQFIAGVKRADTEGYISDSSR
jgi:phosphoribosylanthranilate isomerase